MSITGKRLAVAMDRNDTDQSKLARDIGVTQGAISKILLGKTSNSRLLPRLATHLGASLPWLLGMTDDPEDGAPTVRPTPTAQLYLRVELPSEEALAAMFESLLDGLDHDAPRSEQALQLAQRLPIGLSQLVDARPAPPRKVRRPAAPADREEALATADPGRRS